jgi:hypothetical protein
VSGKLRKADGTIMVESPEMALSEQEKSLTGNLGLMTYVGKGRFWDFSDETRVAEAGEATEGFAGAPLGEDWVVSGGDWAWANDARTALAQKAAKGTTAAVNTALTGTKGTYRASITPQEGAKAVGLLFQVSPDMEEGFEIRLGDGVTLQTLSGRTLFEKPDFAWMPGKTYLIEGIVVTDRVSLKVSDTEGGVLLKGDDFYVSDTNNTRVGGIGFKTNDGAAQFADWSVRPLE